MIDKNKILGKLKENRIPIKKIAKDCQCSVTYVHRLIADGPRVEESKKYQVFKMIADLIGMSFEEVWGASETFWTGINDRKSNNAAGQSKIQP